MYSNIDEEIEKSIDMQEKRCGGKVTKLVWNVFTLDFNNNQIIVENIFDHPRFFQDLIKCKQKYPEYPLFAQHVQSSLLYYFWAKCEWEVILTSWPPYMTPEEIDKLHREMEERKANGHPFYRYSPKLEVAEKVDVYDQVMMNFDAFMHYLWENRNLLKKPRAAKE